MGGIKSFFMPKLPNVQAQIAPPLAMPDQNDPAALEARRRTLAATRAQKGRASTDLTSPDRAAPTFLNDTLGET